MKAFLKGLRGWALDLRAQLRVAYFAARDPRLPWAARLLALAVVAYALSPIDLIPDFIPVLGLLDDLLIVPLGLALVLRLTPPAVLDAARRRVAAAGRLPASRVAALAIVALWLLLVGLAARWAWRRCSGG